MKERFTKFIDTIIALDKGDHTFNRSAMDEEAKMDFCAEVVLGDCTSGDISF